MTDQELLGLAAKAAGYTHYIDSFGFSQVEHGRWNPLINDVDAFRLMVKLQLDLQFSAGATWAQIKTGYTSAKLLPEPHGDNPAAATRRAIVLAAAHTFANSVLR